MKEITIVIPESFSVLDALNCMINKVPGYLKKQEMELFYVAQKDESVMFLVKEKLQSIYLEGLKNDNERFKNLLSLILVSQIDMTGEREALFPLRQEAISSYLKGLDFSILASIFILLMEDLEFEGEKDHFVVDAFSGIILEKVSKNESLDSIEKVLINSSDYCWENIGSKVEEKLGITIS